jgi:YVTN family beta-propeller protein
MNQNKPLIFFLLSVAFALSLFTFFKSPLRDFLPAKLIAPRVINYKSALPGMPTNANPINVYAAAGVNAYSPIVQSALPRVYVPNSDDGTVSIIDPTTYRVIAVYRTGKNPQHVVPAYDLKTLFALNDRGYSLTPFNPQTGTPSNPIKVDDPYNMYFTPDGQYAIVVNEAQKKLDFRDPHTFALKESVPVDCKGVNHMDFTADGRFALITCEFSGQLLKLDVSKHQVLGYLNLDLNNAHVHSMPQDIRLSPDGSKMFVADMAVNGVFIIDPNSFTQIGFVPTGVGTHGIYPSRDGRWFYISNRGCTVMQGCKKHGPGGIAVLDPRTNTVVATWPIPGGGSPDMGNVSGNGQELWLSGRYDNEVYVFDTQTGQLTHRIPVGKGPHGLAVWPQPGRYSLGHTGNMR